MIKRMTKYSFVIFHKDVEGFLNGMQELGVMDITRQSKAVDETSSQMFDSIARYDNLLKELEKVAGQEAAKKSKGTGPAAAALPDDAPFQEPLLEAGEALIDQKKMVSSERASLKARLSDALPWGNFNPEDIARIQALGLTPHFYSVAQKRMDSYAESLHNEYPVYIINSTEGKVYFVLLTEKGVEPQLPFPESKIPQIPYNVLQEDIERCDKTIEEIDSRLLALYSFKEQIERQKNALENKADLYLAGESAAKAAEGTLDVFTGFAPVENDGAIKDYLSKNSDGVYYISQSASVEDNPPIALRNNKFTRMFSLLTDMYGRPNYGEFDPTPYMSVFFLLFFAMCMGDCGYGILLILIGLALKKAKGAAKFATLVMTLGAATMVVGFILNTFFGVEVTSLSWVPSPMKRIIITGDIAGTTYKKQMVLALIIGIVHICIAMVVKAIYSTKNKGFANSIGTWGWTLLIVGGVIVGGISLSGVLDKEVTKWIVIVLGIVSALGIFIFNDIHSNPLKNIGTGLWETYNTATGLLGDVLSYIRLYALGLAGGMLGTAFNNLGMSILGDDINSFSISWIFFILIVVVGHVLNLAMCCLGAFVHPLRLNFLEFFKNSGYEGSGKTYKPLTINK